MEDQGATPQIVTARTGENRQWEGPLNFSTIGIRKPEWTKSTFCGTSDAKLEKMNVTLSDAQHRLAKYRAQSILDSCSWLNNAH